MILEFSHNKINMMFEVTEQNTVTLKYFSAPSSKAEKNLKWCSIADVHL